MKKLDKVLPIVKVKVRGMVKAVSGYKSHDTVFLDNDMFTRVINETKWSWGYDPNDGRFVYLNNKHHWVYIDPLPILTENGIINAYCLSALKQPFAIVL